MTNPCIGCKDSWHAERNCNCAVSCKKLSEYKEKECIKNLVKK